MSVEEMTQYLVEIIYCYVNILNNIYIGDVSLLGFILLFSLIAMCLVIVFRVEVNGLFEYLEDDMYNNNGRGVRAMIGNIKSRFKRIGGRRR